MKTLNTGFSWGQGPEQRTWKHCEGGANSAGGLKLTLTWVATIIVNTGLLGSRLGRTGASSSLWLFSQPVGPLANKCHLL